MSDRDYHQLPTQPVQPFVPPTIRDEGRGLGEENSHYHCEGKKCHRLTK